jgi:hypothetical protein
VLGVRTPSGVLIPLVLRMEVCATQEEAESNLSNTFALDYERFNEHMRTSQLHICGAGPSLEDSYQEISGDVLACNSALGFLLDHDVVPRYAMIWDASPLLVNFAIPNPSVTYLLASRCHPSVFERLRGCKIVVWHAGGDYDITGVLERAGINEPMVNGGSAAVTRALYLAYALGYRELHLHGADSSYRGDRTHVRGSLVPEKRLTVCAQRKFFDTTPEWAAQVEEFKCIYEAFKQPDLNAKIIVHGDGLLPYVANLIGEASCQ